MEVTVKIFGKKLGTLYDNDGFIQFQYDAKFIENGFNISPYKLPFTTELYSNIDNRYFQTLAGVFFDSLPDKFGTKVLEAYYESKGVSSHELSVLQKLIFLGKRGMGALEYEPSEKILDIADIAEPLEIRAMYDASKKIIQGKPTQAINEMLLFMDSGASAGGARAKAVVGWDRDTNIIISGSGELADNYEHWLVKFDTEDEHKNPLDYTKLEYIYMNMAKECGIATPQMDLIKDDKLTHFAIKRFDRIDNKKFHMHSLASMVHVNFNEQLHYSYDEAIRMVRFITKDAQAVEEFYKRMVFNVLGVNQDDHAKNTSFLMNEQGEWSLSPAYDITYAKGQNYTKNHQMSIFGKVNNFTKEELVEFGVKFGLKKDNVLEIIDTTAKIVSSFSQRAKELDIREDLVSLVSQSIQDRIVNLGI